MKTEFLYHYRKRHGLRARDRVVAYLPRYAPWATRLSPLLNLRDRLPGLRKLSELTMGLSARRSWPRWQRDFFSANATSNTANRDNDREVVLFVDTFNNYFEPENAHAALDVLTKAGYRVHLPRPLDGRRPLCCGRTLLSAGLVQEAKEEAKRVIDALRPYVERGIAIVGLEPSCLLTLRDEFKAMLPGEESNALAEQAMLFEEFIARENDGGYLTLPLAPVQWPRALLHGHCHQKAFGAMAATERTLRMVPELEVEVIESSCCGMAGAFGFEAEHFDISNQMGELTLLPAVRAAASGTVIVADGFSCRHQIRDGAQRKATHIARVLQSALTQ